MTPERSIPPEPNPIFRGKTLTTLVRGIVNQRLQTFASEELRVPLETVYDYLREYASEKESASKPDVFSNAFHTIMAGTDKYRDLANKALYVFLRLSLEVGHRGFDLSVDQKISLFNPAQEPCFGTMCLSLAQTQVKIAQQKFHESGHTIGSGHHSTRKQTF